MDFVERTGTSYLCRSIVRTMIARCVQLLLANLYIKRMVQYPEKYNTLFVLAPLGRLLGRQQTKQKNLLPSCGRWWLINYDWSYYYCYYYYIISFVFIVSPVCFLRFQASLFSLRLFLLAPNNAFAVIVCCYYYRLYFKTDNVQLCTWLSTYAYFFIVFLPTSGHGFSCSFNFFKSFFCKSSSYFL